MTQLLVALLLGSVLVSCGDEDGDGVQVLTDTQSGSEIELDAGEQFEVQLESNPSTGFAWEISAMTTPDLVTFDSTNYIEPESDLVGAAGTEVFAFTAGSEAAGILRLEYIRSFDDPIVPERVVEYIVRIDGADWPPDPGEPPTVDSAVAPE